MGLGIRVYDDVKTESQCERLFISKRVLLQGNQVRNILLVDGSQTITNALESRVRDGNVYNPVVCHSDNEARTSVKDGQKFHVAIVDLMLPGSKDGALVNFMLNYGIPTIVLSGTVDSSLRKTILSKPIVEYYVKNSMDDLESAVQMAENLEFLRKREVLIVDSSRVGRMDLSQYLQPLGLIVLEADTATKALKIITSHPGIKIIFVSNTLKDWTGTELVKRLKSTPNRMFNVFGIATDEKQDLRINFLKSGADDLIIRPIIKEELNIRVINSIKMQLQHDEIKNYVQTVDKYVITSETDRQGNIRYISEAFQNISGYTLEALMGVNHRILRHQDMPDSIYEELWETISEGLSWEGEIKNRRNDGSFYWVRAHIDPVFDYDGEITGFRAIRQDITDKKMLAEAQKNIMDSIHFASLIQRAILPPDGLLKEIMPDHFVIWEPKDIVGGDIYFCLPVTDGFLLFVIDCAGHGVPGAFMTMITKTVLDAIVSEKNCQDPADILRQLNRKIKGILRQDREDSVSDNGLDGGLIYYNAKASRLRYAGAKTPLFFHTRGEISTWKSDKQSIGYKRTDVNFEFQNYEMEITDTTRIYLTTDGFLEQTGGEQGFRFSKSNFKKLIEKHRTLPMEKQRNAFMEDLRLYMGEEQQMDDITLVAFEIKK